MDHCSARSRLGRLVAVICTWTACWQHLDAARLPAKIDVCAAVRSIHDGFVPTLKSSGENLLVCTQELSCCTEESEARIATQSRIRFDRALLDSVHLHHLSFSNYMTVLDEFVLDLINKSSIELDKMFVKTYGSLYQRNTDVFLDLFRKLHQVYQSNDVLISDVVENFFSRLFQRLFVILKDKPYTDAFFECVTEQLENLHPFGDIPGKLIKQIGRSLVATQTFVQTLRVGNKVIDVIAKLEHSKSCLDSVTRLLGCSFCDGQPSHVKPCWNYCETVMQTCLTNHTSLNDAWNGYISELLKIAARLKSSFNLESAITPINVRISEAIMYFQDNSVDISDKVFQGCGKKAPEENARRLRRAITTNETSRGDHSEESSHRSSEAGTNFEELIPSEDLSHRLSESGINFEELIREIQIKLELAKDLWKNLSDDICNRTATAADNGENQNCWNAAGKIRGTYDVVTTQPTSKNKDTPGTNVIVERELLQLKQATAQLHNAYLGKNNIEDEEMDELSGSGDDYSASGTYADTYATLNVSVYVTTSKGPNDISSMTQFNKPTSGCSFVSNVWPIIVLFCLFLHTC